VKKSRQAPEYARRAAAKGADVPFVWGGDGTVQRCIDAVAGTATAVAILPAGTANLLAANLGVPHDIAQAVRVGLHGDRRRLDTGTVNGEHFNRRRRPASRQETAGQGPPRLGHGLRPADGQLMSNSLPSGSFIPTA